MKRRVFDAHFHVGEWGRRDYYGHLIRPLVREHRNHFDCAEYLRRTGITCGLVVPTYLDLQEINFDYNKLVIDCVNNVPNLYGGIWVSPLPECTSLTNKELDSLNHPKVKALKMSAGTWGSFSFDPRSWDQEFKTNLEHILDASHEKHLVLQLHTGSGNSDPCKLDEFMKKYGSRTAFHFIHMGESTGEVLKFVPRFVEWIRAGFDVYTDQVMTPGFGVSWMIQELQGIDGGIERLLFGTDSPWSGLKSEYWKIEELEIDDSVKEKILWENACALYKVKTASG